MKQVICDSCGKSCSYYSYNEFEYKVHLETSGIVGYVDSEFNKVGGKNVVVDLCNSCYNGIVGLAVTELLKRMQK